MKGSLWRLLGLFVLLWSASTNSAAAERSPAAPQTLSHGRFTDLAIYRPVAVKQVVLLLSGDGGWNGAVVEMARVLQEDGALVIGIDTQSLFENLQQDDAECVFPDGDLENLSHFVQAYYKLPGYKIPLLVGYSAGASLAYAVLAQAPPQTFAGALSVGFCVEMELLKPLCKGESAQFARRVDGKGMDLLPSKTLAAPWTVLQGAFDTTCDTEAARRFASKVAASEFILAPKVGHNYAIRADWVPQFRAAVAQLNTRRPDVSLPVREKLIDLPIVEVAAVGKGDTFAVLLSGDGGWAGLDKEIAAAIAGQGIPVVGLDSLRYFWSARTPASTAADIDRIVRFYGVHWQKPKVILIGYSQGADVLPFAVNRLPAATRKKVQLLALLGPGTRATFEFHLSDWIANDSDGLPIRPEIDKFTQLSTLCVYGEDEDDSLCPELASSASKVVKRAGGHHFGGEYEELARLILQHAANR